MAVASVPHPYLLRSQCPNASWFAIMRSYHERRSILRIILPIEMNIVSGYPSLVNRPPAALPTPILSSLEQIIGTCAWTRLSFFQ